MNRTHEARATQEYWNTFTKANSIRYSQDAPKTEQTLLYRLHAAIGRRLTDAEALTVHNKIQVLMDNMRNKTQEVISDPTF